MKSKTTFLVEWFNMNYNSNDDLILEFLNSYIHSSHCIVSYKQDGSYIRYQPSYANKTVEKYTVFYDEAMRWHHKSGRICLDFTDGTVADIGLYKFKKYLCNNRGMFIKLQHIVNYKNALKKET